MWKRFFAFFSYNPGYLTFFHTIARKCQSIRKFQSQRFSQKMQLILLLSNAERDIVDLRRIFSDFWLHNCVFVNFYPRTVKSLSSAEYRNRWTSLTHLNILIDLGIEEHQKSKWNDSQKQESEVMVVVGNVVNIDPQIRHFQCWNGLVCSWVKNPLDLGLKEFGYIHHHREERNWDHILQDSS